MNNYIAKVSLFLVLVFGSNIYSLETLSAENVLVFKRSYEYFPKNENFDSLNFKKITSKKNVFNNMEIYSNKFLYIFKPFYNESYLFGYSFEDYGDFVDLIYYNDIKLITSKNISISFSLRDYYKKNYWIKFKIRFLYI